MQKNFVLRLILVLIAFLVVVNIFELQFRDNDSREVSSPILTDVYSYVLNPGEGFCGADKGDHLLFVSFNPSGTNYFAERAAIRNTWANKVYADNRHIRNVFIIGLSSNESVNTQIRLESRLYGDIVQGNFIDTYRNLTLKTILGIKWVSEYCDNAKFVLKVDDDMVVNTKSLVAYFLQLNKNNTMTPKNSMYGLCVTTVVQRDNTSKFYVPVEEFSGDRYPMYCIGSAYIFTSDLMKPMYNLTKYVKPFVMEDVYVGMLAKELNSTFVNIWYYWSYNPYVAINFTIHAKMELVHFVNVYGLGMFYSVWNLIASKNLDLLSKACNLD